MPSQKKRPGKRKAAYRPPTTRKRAPKRSPGRSHSPPTPPPKKPKDRLREMLNSALDKAVEDPDKAAEGLKKLGRVAGLIAEEAYRNPEETKRVLKNTAIRTTAAFLKGALGGDDEKPE